jgi:membrane-bound serine protease (ClpP class)
MLYAIRAQRSPIKTGQEAMVGRQGLVTQEIPAFGAGQVQLGGELWTAELSSGTETLQKGSRVEVVSVEGIRLRVKQVGQ